MDGGGIAGGEVCYPPPPSPLWQLAFAVVEAVTVTADRSVAAGMVVVVVSLVAVASGSGCGSERG